MTTAVFHHHRAPLSRTKRAIERGQLTVGFIGGSITDGRPGNNWPEPFAAWLKNACPGVRIAVENAAIGGTGTDLAVFRAQRDLIDRKCDLVIVEFAVNDWFATTERRNRTREGLLRKLLRDGERDVVVLYSFWQGMYEDYMNGRIPDSVAEFEALAEHYRLNSVNMGLKALDDIRRGWLRWEEWLPDTIHPTERGSLCYAGAAIDFLRSGLTPSETAGIPVGEPAPEPERPAKLPAPLFADHWGEATFLPLSEVIAEGPWIVRRAVDNVWLDQLLATSAIGARLRFEFVGGGLCFGFDFGKASADFRYRLDGGDWTVSEIDRENWIPNTGYFKLHHVIDGLPREHHTFELEVVHGNRERCVGTNFRLAFIGIL